MQLLLDAVPGEKKLFEVSQADGSSLLALAQGVAWQGLDGQRREYVFIAAEDQATYFAQLRRLRGQFLVGGAVMLGLAALVIALVVGFLLRPLRLMERQIAAVELGERGSLDGDWPRELRGVAQNLNALLQAERERAERYRNTLGNLAHSLKTPLSVLRALLGGPPAPEKQGEMAEQVDRMQDIVQHQLRRATTGSLAPGVAWTPVLPVLDDVLGALRKVYGGRGLKLSSWGEGGGVRWRRGRGRGGRGQSREAAFLDVAEQVWRNGGDDGCWGGCGGAPPGLGGRGVCRAAYRGVTPGVAGVALLALLVRVAWLVAAGAYAGGVAGVDQDRGGAGEGGHAAGVGGQLCSRGGGVGCDDP